MVNDAKKHSTETSKELCVFRTFMRSRGIESCKSAFCYLNISKCSKHLIRCSIKYRNLKFLVWTIWFGLNGGCSVIFCLFRMCSIRITSFYFKTKPLKKNKSHKTKLKVIFAFLRELCDGNNANRRENYIRVYAHLRAFQKEIHPSKK